MSAVPTMKNTTLLRSNTRSVAGHTLMSKLRKLARAGATSGRTLDFALWIPRLIHTPLPGHLSYSIGTKPNEPETLKAQTQTSQRYATEKGSNAGHFNAGYTLVCLR